MTYLKTYHVLPEEAVAVRRAVFVEEQGFTAEFDDKDAVATHVVLFNGDDRPIAVCRYFWNEEHRSYMVGRIAVVKEFRHHHYGEAILKEAEKQIREAGGESVLLAAQVEAKNFYRKQGYISEGNEFLEEHCPHIWMRKSLK